MESKGVPKLPIRQLSHSARYERTNIWDASNKQHSLPRREGKFKGSISVSSRRELRKNRTTFPRDAYGRDNSWHPDRVRFCRLFRCRIRLSSHPKKDARLKVTCHVNSAQTQALENHKAV